MRADSSSPTPSSFNQNLAGPLSLGPVLAQGATAPPILSLAPIPGGPAGSSRCPPRPHLTSLPGSQRSASLGHRPGRTTNLRGSPCPLAVAMLNTSDGLVQPYPSHQEAPCPHGAEQRPRPHSPAPLPQGLSSTATAAAHTTGPTPQAAAPAPGTTHPAYSPGLTSSRRRCPGAASLCCPHGRPSLRTPCRCFCPR